MCFEIVELYNVSGFLDLTKFVHLVRLLISQETFKVSGGAFGLHIVEAL
jgi:hypothetical protein